MPEKYVWNINKMPEFYMILARKINKINEFYTIFPKISEFYIIIAGKYFPDFLGGRMSPRFLRLWYWVLNRQLQLQSEKSVQARLLYTVHEKICGKVVS